MSEPCHALVFRDVREQLCLRTASAAVCEDLSAFLGSQDQEHLVSALLRVGEMECALADAWEDIGAGLTATIANALVEPGPTEGLAEAARKFLEQIPYKSLLSVSRPEGYAFYGLHPLDYADALETMDVSGDGPVIVIGVRTVGFTLGEVVAASLRSKFRGARRVQSFSVRPVGHPYDRHCTFTEKQIGMITEDGGNVRVIVVDEGPGMSGSSFLSVGEALVALGVKPSQTTFLCSRDANPAQLVTPNGAERWSRFKRHVAERNHFKPEIDAVFVAEGAWRNAISDESEWPGRWTTMLPATCCSADGERVFEYCGLGRYGEDIRERVNRLADLGFAEKATRAANGFARVSPASGRRLEKSDLSEAVLNRIAEYLALRAKLFAVESDLVTSEFKHMARFNFAQTTGRELPDDLDLPVHRAVISDSQMMPYQWLQPDDGSLLLKLDCATHGDNHFFPGPVDSAWDIAGAMVEWEMDERSRDYLVRRYAELTSDNVSARLTAYLVAYAALRNGYCRMAASAMSGDAGEQERLLRDARTYSDLLQNLVPEKTLTVSAYE